MPFWESIFLGTSILLCLETWAAQVSIHASAVSLLCVCPISRYSSHTHMQNLAVFTMMASATMENWVSYAVEVMGGSQSDLDPLAIAYFVSYIIIVAYILTSVVMAVLVENFSNASQEEDAEADAEAVTSKAGIISADSPLDPILANLASVDSTLELDHCTISCDCRA